jgi:hypothetical protein
MPSELVDLMGHFANRRLDPSVQVILSLAATLVG